MVEGKVAIVTRGGKVIGAEIALHLLAQNSRVVVAEVAPHQKNFDLNP